jgi:DNA-binding NtrC family response regulator
MRQFSVGTPGNIEVEQTQPQTKQLEEVSAVQVATETNEEPILSLRSLRAQVESQAIKSALQRTGWNRKQAARLLKISYRGLLYKIHRHNISPTTEQA